MQESKIHKSSAQERLEALVRQTIEQYGEEFEGKIWAILPREEWAEMAGVSTRTVTRTFQSAPFDTLQKLVERQRATLVRVGKPDPNQPSRLAAKMAKIFRDNIVQNEAVNAKQKAICKAAGREWKPKKSVTPREYGCLIHLAQDFRQDWQLEIFKYAISAEGWKATKDLSKYKTEDHLTPLYQTGGTVKPLPGKFHHYHKYPHIPTLRVLWMCAESAFVAAKLDGTLSKEEHAFFLDWWKKRDASALLEWEPNWKHESDPTEDAKA